MPTGMISSRLAFRVLACAATVPFLAACSGDPEARSVALMRSGDQYAAKKQFKEAIIEYRKAVQIRPRFGEVRFKLANSYVQASDLPHAYAEYVRAADLMPANSEAPLGAGQFLLMASDYEGSRLRAQSVLQREPKNVEAQVLLGNSLAGLKDLSGGIAEVEQAIENEPRRVMTYTNLGLLQLASGKHQRAETTFKNAVKVAPQSATAHLALANFYAATNDVEKAELEFKAAVEAEPTNPIASQAVAAFYLTTGRVDRAEPYLRAYAKQSNDTSALLTLADYYLAANRRDEAMPILRQVAGTSDGFIPATLRLASIAFESNDKATAYKEVNAVRAAAPNNAQALVLHARFRAAEGDLKEALRLAVQAAAAEPTLPAPYFVQGRDHGVQGSPADAVQAFTEVLKRAQAHAMSALAIARIHLAQGEFDAAAQAAQQALTAQPSSSDARLLLVQAFLAERNLTGAQLEIDKLL